MTTAADRRLAKLESTLSPREAVLAWLVEAQQFPTIEDHARSIAQLPVEAAPLSVIGQRVEASVRASMKGKPKDDVWDAVRRGVGDATFLYILVLQINARAHELARVEGLRAAGVFYWMGYLLGGPREADLTPEAWEIHTRELDRCWASWRTVVDRLNDDVRVESAARARLEQRHFSGRDVFFPDVAEAWSSYVDLVERITGLAEMMAPAGKPKSRRREADASAPMASVEERVAYRVQTLADDARVRAYGVMGERERGVAIMERRLREAQAPGS